eukprot:3196217-Rhodomonas_salina.1
MRVSGPWFRVSGFARVRVLGTGIRGFRVWGLEDWTTHRASLRCCGRGRSRVRVSGLYGLGFDGFGFRAQRLKLRVCGFRIEGFGHRLSGFGLGLSGFGLRLSGFGLRLS